MSADPPATLPPAVERKKVAVEVTPLPKTPAPVSHSDARKEAIQKALKKKEKSLKGVYEAAESE